MGLGCGGGAVWVSGCRCGCAGRGVAAGAAASAGGRAAGGGKPLRLVVAAESTGAVPAATLAGGGALVHNPAAIAVCAIAVLAAVSGDVTMLRQTFMPMIGAVAVPVRGPVVFVAAGDRGDFRRCFIVVYGCIL